METFDIRDQVSSWYLQPVDIFSLFTYFQIFFFFVPIVLQAVQAGPSQWQEAGEGVRGALAEYS